MSHSNHNTSHFLSTFYRLCSKQSAVLLFLLLSILVPLKLEAQKVLVQADRAYTAQDYKQALELYQTHEKSIVDSIQKLPFLLKIASCYSELNNPIVAIKYYRLVLNIDDRLNDEQGLDYINVLIETGQYDEASNFLENFDGIIYFENIIFNTCDYALENPSVDKNTHVKPISSQFGTAVFGILPLEENIIYAVPFDASKKLKTQAYLYSSQSDTSIKHELINKNLSKISLYTPTLNPEKQLLYFSGNMSEDKIYYESIRSDQKIGAGGSNNLGIFKVSLDSNNTKARPEILSFINFEYNTTHPFFSQDKQTLYFTSDLPGGYGGYDIYYSKMEDGNWSRPINMGANVNTIMNEGYPFVVGDKMYFASTGHPGYGGLDLFEYNLSTHAIKNLGKPINSSFDDFYIIFMEENSGFFISNREREDGKDIIYSFEKN